jgi:hypothetical protein
MLGIRFAIKLVANYIYTFPTISNTLYRTYLTASNPLLLSMIYTKNVHVTRLSTRATCTQALLYSFLLCYLPDRTV